MNKIFLLFFSLIAFITSKGNIDERLSLANELRYSNPDSSFNICCSVEEELQNTNERVKIAEAKLCKGRYFLLKADIEKATEQFNSAIKTFEAENEPTKLAKCYSLKSLIFLRLDDYSKSINHLQKAYNLYLKNDNVKGQISTLTNLSLNYIHLKQNDSTLLYLNKLKKIENQIKGTSKYYYFQNFGLYHHNIKNYNQAIKYFNLALKVAEHEKMTDSKTTIHMEFAQVYLAQKKYLKAEQHIYKSIAIASNNSLMHEANEAYLLLIKLYEEKKDFKNAFLAKVLNDSIEKEIYNIERINKINELETELVLTEKQKIIAQQELEIKNEQVNTLNAQSKISQLIFIVVLCILIIVFIVIIFIRARKLSNKIKHQKILLEEKNNEITDSITYAKRIQSAILPSIDYFKTNLPNSFIFYKPKDIVAGDFYWMKTINSSFEGGLKVGENQSSSSPQGKNVVLFAAADCTGHGVPGAMVSVVCSNALNQSIEKIDKLTPSSILDITRDLVKNRFKTEDNNVKDGMDIALCSIDYATKKLQFSGANNPLYIVRKGALIEIKGDKQHIGKHHKESPFTNHIVDIENDDCIYLFSDGYADQFGGPKGKKFMYKQFKALLVKIASEPVDKQKEILFETFKNWKGELEQIDDVCVIGVKI